MFRSHMHLAKVKQVAPGTLRVCEFVVALPTHYGCYSRTPGLKPGGSSEAVHFRVLCELVVLSLEMVSYHSLINLIQPNLSTLSIEV